MTNLPHFISSVGGKYGAPMGRVDYGHPTAMEPGSLRIYRMVMHDAYDIGGAYWGSGEPLYCLATDEEEVALYGRAKSAKAFWDSLGFDNELLATEDPFPVDYSRLGYDDRLELKYEHRCVDVTPIIEAFEEGDLDPYRFQERGSSRSSWVNAKDAAESLSLPSEFYTDYKSHLIECGMDRETLEENDEQEFRALLLQELSIDYLQYLDSEYDSYPEYCNDPDGRENGSVSCGDDGSYSFYIGI